MDFEGALKALEPYDHFHTESLRGLIKNIQLKTDEAFEHFRKAEEKAKRTKLSPMHKTYLFYLRWYEAGTATTAEALNPGGNAAERTDREMLRFTSLDEPDVPVFDQIRITQIAYYNIIRGDFQTALETFEFLSDESQGRLEEQQVAFSCGAAAAAKELGLDERCERHYENAALRLNMVTTPFKIALYTPRLYALMMHWGRPDEARDWMRRLERLDCPEESRRCFIGRAKILTSASAARKQIFIS